MWWRCTGYHCQSWSCGTADNIKHAFLRFSVAWAAVLTQKQSDGKWKPVVFISHMLTPIKRRSAQIEKEALTTYGILRDKQYLIRKQFHIKTDHKPLVPILGLKNLDEMSPQIQCLHMCLLRFNFTVSHVLGKRLITTNTLLVIQSPCSPAGWSVLYWRGDWFICSTYIGLQRRSLSNTVAILQRRLARQNQSVRHT